MHTGFQELITDFTLYDKNSDYFKYLSEFPPAPITETTNVKIMGKIMGKITGTKLWLLII